MSQKSTAQMKVGKFTAIRDSDQVTLKGPIWSDVFTVEDLPKRTAFYQQMFDQYGRPTYLDIATVLRAVQPVD